MSESQTRPYAVIGAGPMGLVMARELARYGVPFQGFELHSGAGGLWDIENPHSTMYESAHLISSKTMTELKEFPMPDSVATYPSHRDVGAYFKAYAKHFNLDEQYQYNAKVLGIEKVESDYWKITWENTQTGDTQVFDAQGVLIATGTLHYPNMPKVPGNFTGEVIHSGDYKKAESFKDQRVLIVGCGNSGCDIAVDAVHHAKSVGLSVRRGYYFLPKFVLGKAIDTLGGKLKLPGKLKRWVDSLIVRALVGKPSQYGLPEPDYRLYESHPVMNSLILHHLGHGDISPMGSITDTQDKLVKFHDGKEAEFDKIVFATGYKLKFPFIDQKYLNWQTSAPHLYLNVFNPNEPNVCMLGMVEATGLGWQGRADQAKMVALYLKAQQGLGVPSAIEHRIEENNTDLSGGMKYLKLDRMSYYVHKETYLGLLSDHIAKLENHLNLKDSNTNA
ncbi:MULTISPECIES: NAD(P)/FAD-dependent oxidoreductase [Gammaproteobacteria]|uniref:flavin-containing monooxygenase n=1 Tax=Gammaproteobacteria TaxID=1236 RepID=UPI000DD053F7|nr:MULTISPECIES: NAD(P)-binding domain-containing protein [Gammaproteobacteria]RTE85941.1 NAD(P)/FAD-dependent oxidoreductase [Aliidiomarina sp. B3213]TCZ90060.1 NAD(P)/FAD-dependent oxidoreductase [Lysobacter sp. N42]